MSLTSAGCGAGYPGTTTTILLKGNLSESLSDIIVGVIETRDGFFSID